ncbi:MAG: hypothetical protein K6E20_03440 [Acholeplasmatales bacterium]|nr:hypothetical protein [Acholeplasmatales bacterium]
MSKKKKIKESKQLENEVVDASDNPEIKTKADVKEKKASKEKKKFELWKEFSVYRFIIEIFAAALLITLGIIILVNVNDAMAAIFIIISTITLLLMLFRIIVLLKTRKKDKKSSASYKIIIVEFIVQFVISILFIIAALATIKSKDSDSKTLEDIKDHFDKYFAPYTALLLYSASVSYFVRAIIFSESESKFVCFTNIAYITLALVLCAFREGLTAKVMAIIIASIALVIALFAAIDAGGSFYNYNNRNKKAKEKASEEGKENKEDKGLDLPAEDKGEYNDINPNITPTEEPQENEIVQ